MESFSLKKIKNKHLKNFLVIGFGGMGCRHAQSLATIDKIGAIYILEKNISIYNLNLKRIGHEDNSKFILIDNVKDVAEEIELCVIATPSGPRYEIMKSLVSLNINYFLLEKVVFQTKKQFLDISTLLPPEKIYINYVNRYFSNYESIKTDAQEKKILMEVIGGDFGLGCNLLHYLDLFQYMGAHNISTSAYNLTKNDTQHKRGKDYKEVHGQVSFISSNGSKLNVIADINRDGSNEIKIAYNEIIHVINEQTQNHFIFHKNKIEKKKLEVVFTSALTAKIYEDIITNQCKLPNLSETIHNHLLIFEIINHSLNLNHNDPCPIT